MQPAPHLEWGRGNHFNAQVSQTSQGSKKLLIKCQKQAPASVRDAAS